MAKFKVGDRVRCAELRKEDGDGVNVCAGEGVVMWEVVGDDGDVIYNVQGDVSNRDGWYYPAEKLSIIPSLITTIEWYAPDENLPYDGANVYFIADGDHFAGSYCENGFKGNLCWCNGDPVEFSNSEVQFWAYAPEVK